MALKKNVIYIYFKGKHLVTSKSQYQYNHGQFLYFADLDLPQTFEVHFSNTDEGYAKPQIGSNRLVEIPDAYFWTKSSQIYAWIYLHEGTTDGETKYEVIINLERRSEPVYEEILPTQQTTIEMAIAELNNAVDVTTENANKTGEDRTQVSNIKDEIVDLKEDIDANAELATEKAQEAVNASLRSEASAQNAAEYESNAHGYSDEAKDYAQQALESKTIASQKATIATDASVETLGYRDETLVAKNDVLNLRQNVIDYKNETKGYLDETKEVRADVQDIDNEVKDYASQAQASATSASQSATASANSASASAQSANEAQSASTNAETYALNSGNKAVESAQSASASANSASQALGYAQSASASAQSASGYASNAQTSANTASNKASEASTSAQTASQKATESAQSASQALSYKNDAESPKTASQTAQGLAESARDSAVQAKTDAESAKADAESARDEAQTIVDGISGALDDKADIITDTASGSIASFSDGADNLPLKSLVIDINPIQDLSNGDPSPENICPISGWTEINAYNDPLYGGNIEWNQLVNGYRSGSTNGLTLVPDANNKSISISGTITTAFSYDTIGFTRNSPVKIKRDGRRYIIICNQATPYPIRVAGFADCVSVGSYGGVFSNYTPGNQEFTNVLAFHAMEGDTFAVSNFTVQMFDLTTMFGAEIADYVYSLEQANVGAGVTWFKKLFPEDYYEYNEGEKTTVSAVNDKPYTHVNINLGQTVYGGKLDVLSGELVIDRAMVDLGSLDWNRSNNNGVWSHYLFYTNIQTQTLRKNYMCSVYPIASLANITQSPTDKAIYGLTSNTYLYIRDDSYSDVTAFKSAVAGQQLVYELAEPIEIQLSATQLNSLYGVNNIWADSGDVSAEYRADTKLYIAKKIAEAIASITQNGTDNVTG